MEIVVNSKKYPFQLKFQTKVGHFDRNSQFRCVMHEIIQLDIRSGPKSPTQTPSVVRNPTTNPPKSEMIG